MAIPPPNTKILAITYPDTLSAEESCSDLPSIIDAFCQSIKENDPVKATALAKKIIENPPEPETPYPSRVSLFRKACRQLDQTEETILSKLDQSIQKEALKILMKNREEFHKSWEPLLAYNLESLKKQIQSLPEKWQENESKEYVRIISENIVSEETRRQLNESVEALFQLKRTRSEKQPNLFNGSDAIERRRGVICAVRALEIAKIYEPTHYVFFHGQSFDYFPVLVLIHMLRCSSEGKDLPSEWPPIRSPYTPMDLIGLNFLDCLSFAQDHQVRDSLLSVMPHLFSKEPDESPLHFVLQNYNVQLLNEKNPIEQLIESILTQFAREKTPEEKIKTASKELLEIFREYTKSVTQGMLWVIAIPKTSILENLVQITHRFGRSCNCHPELSLPEKLDVWTKNPLDPTIQCKDSASSQMLQARLFPQNLTKENGVSLQTVLPLNTDIQQLMDLQKKIQGTLCNIDIETQETLEKNLAKTKQQYLLGMSLIEALRNNQPEKIQQILQRGKEIPQQAIHIALTAILHGCWITCFQIFLQGLSDDQKTKASTSLLRAMEHTIDYGLWEFFFLLLNHSPVSTLGDVLIFAAKKNSERAVKAILESTTPIPKEKLYVALSWVLPGNKANIFKLILEKTPEPIDQTKLEVSMRFAVDHHRTDILAIFADYAFQEILYSIHAYAVSKNNSDAANLAHERAKSRPTVTQDNTQTLLETLLENATITDNLESVEVIANNNIKISEDKLEQIIRVFLLTERKKPNCAKILELLLNQLPKPVDQKKLTLNILAASHPKLHNIHLLDPLLKFAVQETKIVRLISALRDRNVGAAKVILETILEMSQETLYQALQKAPDEAEMVTLLLKKCPQPYDKKEIMRIIESMIRQNHLNSLPLLLNVADASMQGDALQHAASESNEAMVEMILGKTPSEESLYEALKAGLRTAPLNLYENILAKIKKPIDQKKLSDAIYSAELRKREDVSNLFRTHQTSP